MATREQVYTAKILINDEEAVNKVKKMKDQLAALKKRRDEALREGKIDVWKAANKEVEALNKKIQKQESLAQALNHTLDDMSTAKQQELNHVVRAINKQLDSGAVERNSKEWKALNATLQDTKRQLRVIRDEGAVQESVWGRFFKFLNDSWGGVLIIFQSITGMSQTIHSAVQDYASMEEEMADVRKYTGLTSEQVHELNEEFKRMDTRTSREQLNQLAGAAGRLGITSKEAIKEFVEAADMIGVALGDDLGDGAVDKIGKLAMAFGEDEDKGLKGAMLATGSAINELAQNSAANAGYLVEFTARVAGFGKQMGLTQAQIMGFATVMDENLLKDEMAATAFGNMLTKMQTDTETFARIAGQSVEDFTKLLREDANGAVLALADSLKRADPQQMMKMLDAMGLDGSRAVGVLSTMADKIDDVRRHQERATEAYEKAKSVQGEFNTMNNTVQAKLDKVKKAFKEMTVELGEKLLPVVKYTISGAGMLAKALSVLASFISNNWRGIVTLTAAITGYAVAVAWANTQSKLWHAWEVAKNVAIKAGAAITATYKGVVLLLAAAYNTVTGNVTRATAAMKLFNMVTKASPVGLLVGALSAAAAAFAVFSGKADKAEEAQRRMTETQKRAADAFISEETQVKNLSKAVHDNTLSLQKRKEALDELKRIIPEYNAELSREGKLTRDNTQAIDNYLKKRKEQLLLEAYEDQMKDAYKRQADATRAMSKMIEAYKAGDWGGVQSKMFAKIREEANAANKEVAELEKAYSETLHNIDRMSGSGQGGSATTDSKGGNADSTMDTQTYWQQQLDTWNKKLADLRNNASATATEIEDAAKHVKEAQDKVELFTNRKQLAKQEKKEEDERKKQLKTKADEAKAVYQQQIAEEMVTYRKGEINYTEYMENRHRRTQEYYDSMKAIYGEESAEYRKLLDNRENEEMQYYQWKAKIDEQQISIEKIQREHSIRREYMRQQVVDTEAMNEALFQSDMTYIKQKQNLYKEGSKEWIDLQMQMDVQQKEHQFELEQTWMQKLSQYREQAGQTNYDMMMELEVKGADSFYTTLLDVGKMTQQEYDAIFEHIRRKYAELKAQQTANSDIQAKAAKGLDTAKKTAGTKGVAAGNDAATGIFSITQAISQQKAINEQLKKLYGEDYENNREYQEAKRQLDAETMQQIVAGAQAAYSTINMLMQAASSYAQACSEVEVAKITADYDKQIEAAGKNTKKKEQLEKQKDEAIAKAKTKANKKAMVMEMAQAVAQTAMGAISAYSSTMAGAPYPANLVLAPISAGIALAAGALQIATIKKQHEAETAGYYEGGFTRGRRYRKEAGVVHEGEFVANHQAVENPAILPFLNFIDQAQRNNTIGSLTMQDVSRALSVGGGSAVAPITPIVNVQTDYEELREAVLAHREATELLLMRLEQPINAQVVLTGPDGLNEQQRRLNNMMKNK